MSVKQVKEESIFITVVKRLFKRIKPSTLLILAILLSCNIFAWFIYTTKVDSTIKAHVKAWNVSFLAGDTQLSQEINFEISEIYPGMAAYNRSITATNSGETAANFRYEIISATILGTTYTVDNNLSSSTLLTQLANDYPFTITFSVSNDLITGGGGEGTFALQVVWPYESGDDVTDTYWGNAAYTFHQANPTESSISLVMKITAIQVE